MNHFVVTARLAEALDGEPGWTHPERHRFSHEATGVFLFVFASDVVLVLRDGPDRPPTKALGTKITHRPTEAITAMLEVAQAVVTVRSMKASTAAPPGE